MIPQQLQIATANETELLTTTTLVFEKNRVKPIDEIGRT